MNKQRKLAYLALIVVSIIWGAALPVVKPALSFINPFQFLLGRYLLAAIVSFPILTLLLCKYKPNLKTLLTMVLMEGSVLILGHYLLYEGLSRTSALEASLIGISSPIFITLGGILFLREKEEKNEWLGLVLAVIGTLLVITEPLITNAGKLSISSFSGNFMVLTYMLIWTAYLLIAKKVYLKIPKHLIGFFSPLVGTLGMLMVNNAIIPGEILPKMPVVLEPSVLFALLYMGILGSLAAVPLMIYGNDRIEASEASLFSYLQPLISIPLAIFWLKESSSPIIWIALLMIGVGVIIAERRPRVRKK